MKRHGAKTLGLPRGGIGLRSESSLHSSIREWYSVPGDRFEVRVGDFVVDIVRDGLLIEIQTKNFSSIRKKLRSLVKKNNVRLVYPITKGKTIVRVGISGNEVIGRRRSPKKGRLIDVFDELVSIPDLISEERFTMDVLMIEEEEVRCDDGKGSWRRRGVSIKDRKLVNVVERVTFRNKGDFLSFLPSDLRQPFTNKILAKSLGISVNRAQKMTYCLRRMGAIKEVRKEGNELVFEIAIDRSRQVL